MIRSLLTLVVLVGCVSTQTPPPQTATDEEVCPEPPPPVDPMDRAASLFFEAGDLVEWADGYEESERLPTREELVEHYHALIETIRETERVAAEARIYGAADQARMLLEELLVTVSNFGMELPEGYSVPDALRDDLSQDEPAPDTATMIEDYSGFAMDCQQAMLELADSAEDMAATNTERKTAQCLRVRLYAYTDLFDLVRMLEDDLVHLRLESLQEEDRAELQRLERQLDASRRFLSGCRRGVSESREAARRALQQGGTDDEGNDLQDLAQEILESCS